MDSNNNNIIAVATKQKLLGNENDKDRKICISKSVTNKDKEKSYGIIPTITINSIAKRRWNILAKALTLRNRSIESITAKTQPDEEKLIESNPNQPINSTLSDDYLASVRRFTTFNLFHIKNICVTNENWLLYRTNSSIPEYVATIHHLRQYFTPNELIGFNNTGNICIWPSEEALTYYALNNLSLFKQKHVLELGGGMTCLAGLMIAKYGEADFVRLTDGNDLSIRNAQKTLAQNAINSFTEVECSVLKWEDVVDDVNDSERFDYIISADCLFFDCARTAYIETLWKYMKSTGFGLIMAPQRGQTLKKFVQQAEERGFICNIQKFYHTVIWQKHLELLRTMYYDENIHYPVLIEVKKNTTNYITQ